MSLDLTENEFPPEIREAVLSRVLRDSRMTPKQAEQFVSQRIAVVAIEDPHERNMRLLNPDKRHPEDIASMNRREKEEAELGQKLRWTYRDMAVLAYSESQARRWFAKQLSIKQLPKSAELRGEVV